jgi:hypothetical protein
MSGRELPQNLNDKNQLLEIALQNLQDVLTNSNPETDPALADPLLLFGVGRSGSTMMLQYLAASGQFAYPSNVVSRFFQRPALGHLVQSMLLDPKLDVGTQFAQLRDGIAPYGFDSDLGKTTSPIEPNEFWYFWRRFFDFESGVRLKSQAFLKEPGQGLVNEIAEWSAYAGRPVAMKATIAAWNTDRLLEGMPNARILIVRRDPVETMIALLDARLRYWGDLKKWYGLKLPAAITLRTSDPLEEVALQVATFDNLTERLSADPRCSVVDYAAFCAAPTDQWDTPIFEDYGARGRIDIAQAKQKLAHVSFEFRAARLHLLQDHMHVDRAHLSKLYDKYRADLKDLEYYE